MGSLSFAELTGAEPGVIPVGVPAPRPGGGCCIRDASGMHSLYGKGAVACGGLGARECVTLEEMAGHPTRIDGEGVERPITCQHHLRQIARSKAGLPPCPSGLSGLAGLAGPGWYGSGASGSAFWAGVKELGGGGRARQAMKGVWAQRVPYGFWSSPVSRGWRALSPGNMTPAMMRSLLDDIREYEDRRSYITPPRRVTRHIRWRRPRAAPPPTRAASLSSAYHDELVRWKARVAQGYRDPVPLQPRPPRPALPRPTPRPPQATTLLSSVARPQTRLSVTWPTQATQARPGFASGSMVAPRPVFYSSAM